MSDPIILCDVDGVLLDFVSAANKANGIPITHDDVDEWDWYKKHGVTDDEFWHAIHMWGSSFYEDIVEPYPWAHDLLDLLRTFGPLRFFTKMSKHPATYAGKYNALKQLAPDAALIFTSVDEKWLMAGPGRLLIDDSESNCKQFEKHGGDRIMFPQRWNYFAGYTDDRFGFVKDCLEFSRNLCQK